MLYSIKETNKQTTSERKRERADFEFGDWTQNRNFLTNELNIEHPPHNTSLRGPNR